MVSYPKEEVRLDSALLLYFTDHIFQRDGYTSNVISACRMSGMGAQEAFDYVGGLLAQRYERWESVEPQIPTWGEAVDFHVQRYIEGIKCTVRANLYWR